MISGLATRLQGWFSSMTPISFASRVAPLVISIISLWVSYLALDAGRGQAQVASQMREYLSAYEKIVDRYGSMNPLPLHVDGYKRLNESDRQRIVILAGLLIGVVDIMYLSGDSRVKPWATYIAAFSGPLACYPDIEAYAATSFTLDRMKQEIARLRNQGVKC